MHRDIAACIVPIHEWGSSQGGEAFISATGTMRIAPDKAFLIKRTTQVFTKEGANQVCLKADWFILQIKNEKTSSFALDLLSPFPLCSDGSKNLWVHFRELARACRR